MGSLLVVSTVYREAIESLGSRIVTGEMPVGTTVTLDWLGREVGASRTIAREVVQVLASMGLVTSRRRTGITVQPAESWDVFDPAVIRWRLDGPDRRHHLAELTQLRAAVEPAACALAAERADDAVRHELLALAEAMESSGAAGDLETFLEHDVRFHRLLLESSGNPMFAALCDVVEEVLRARTEHHLMPARPKPHARELHAQVARAVADGAPEGAREAMTAICLEVVTDVAGGSSTPGD